MTGCLFCAIVAGSTPAFVVADVARASDQVDLNINPNLFPPAVAGATPASPAFHLRTTDMWVQSLNLGLEWRF